jgi:hypothetical protein
MVLQTNIKGSGTGTSASLSRRLAKMPGLFAQEWIDVTAYEI